MGGGAVEQDRHPGQERRLLVARRGELEDVTAAEVLGEVGRDHRVEGVVVADDKHVVDSVEIGGAGLRGVLRGIARVER